MCVCERERGGGGRERVGGIEIEKKRERGKDR